MKHAEIETENMSARKEGFLAALLETHNVERAAEQAGVSRATAWRYLNDPTFQATYREHRRRVVETAIAYLQAGMNSAAAALLRNLKCGSPAAEIRAAVAVLQQGFAGMALLDHESRLAALELAAGANGRAEP